MELEALKEKALHAAELRSRPHRSGRARSSRRNFIIQLKPMLEEIEQSCETMTDPKQLQLKLALMGRVAAIKNAPNFRQIVTNLQAIEKLWGLHSEKKVLEITRDDATEKKTKEQIIAELIESGVIEREHQATDPGN
jgi:predicted regulator of amino acid metabolism with ACT domain